MTAPIYTLTEIDAAEARAEAATQGPWNNRYCRYEVHNKHDRLIAVVESSPSDTDQHFRDGDFIAHARTDVPRLAATARTAIEQRDAAIELLLQLKAERRHNRIFLASKQQIKQPEGTALYDELTADMDAYLAGRASVSADVDALADEVERCRGLAAIYCSPASDDYCPSCDTVVSGRPARVHELLAERKKEEG